MSKSAKLFGTRSLCSALVFSTIVGCGGGSTDDHGGDAPSGVEVAKSSLAHNTAPSSAGVQALGADNAKFAFELYRHLATDNADKNLIFSPYSISTALAMTYEGARGTTESEMKSALHFDLDKPALHEAFNATALALDARGQGKQGADGMPFRLNVNNSIWAQRGYAVVPAFLDVMAVNYGAGVFLADFAKDPDGSRKAINGWVSQKTEQLIPELLPSGSLDPSTVLVLTNTVYFNAGWKTKFEKQGTHDATFTKLGGGTVVSKQMNALLSIPYAEGDNFRAVALPYEDDRLRFVAILPSEGALASFEASVSGSWFTSLNQRWKDTEVALSLPQLDYEQSAELTPPLMTMGMRAAFGVADFSGMANGALYIDAIFHQAVLKVFEGGTIAAAATAVVAKDESADPEPEQTIRFDRPFLFAIVDQPSGEVLFLGRVLDPTAK